MSKNEFDSVGFALGTVRGTRAFNVDALGRLLGVSYDSVWTPGENIAVCRAKERSMTKMFFNSIYGNGYRFDFDFESTVVQTPEYVTPFLGLQHPALKAAAEKAAIEKKRQEKKAAEAAARDTLDSCEHGFYAYYEGSNDYGEKAARINGVIEGYGEVVIGTRGFRAMKARIVALHIPKGLRAKHEEKLLRNYPNIPFFPSFKSMVAEFPGDSGGPKLSPETDPDFWTRKV